MTNSITPPNELAQQWYRDAEHQLAPYYVFVARCAAQWGADQELEACLRHLDAKGHHPTVLDALRAARRPQPPSLKEQALALIDACNDPDNDYLDDTALDTIRRALEALDD